MFLLLMVGIGDNDHADSETDTAIPEDARYRLPRQSTVCVCAAIKPPAVSALMLVTDRALHHWGNVPPLDGGLGRPRPCRLGD